MMNFHKKSHEVPGLNTSSLPDLIFSVLFFFMIVTHIRQVMDVHYKRGFPNRRYRGMRGIMQQYIFYYDLYS